ncbi:MAG: dTDP-4-amino-4,6-dideoxygalactose transaminase [Anaerolineaceae bacterium]
MPEIIDFNKPCVVGSEMAYIADAAVRGKLSGDGFYTKQASAILEKEFEGARVLLTTSCTHALEMSALLLDIQPGDEFILPSFTFVSTVNAFVLRGAKPVFIDIRPDTLNMDETLLEGLITSRTKAIIPVHYAGVGCEMEAIMAVANKHNIPVVEDNAHGIFGKYKGKPLGTFGVMATQSFHETKNITCGEGGALVINDRRYLEQAEIIREKGTDRSRFFRGQVDKYSWVSPGSSFLPSELLAAYLFGQLEQREKIQARRRLIWEYYAEHLNAWAEDHHVRLPLIPAWCEQPYHMFYMLMPDLDTRQGMIEHLKSRGIYSVFHYLPLHLSTMGLKFSGKEGDCPVTERVSDQLLRLPMHYELTEENLSKVVKAIKDFDFSG